MQNDDIKADIDRVCGVVNDRIDDLKSSIRMDIELLVSKAYNRGYNVGAESMRRTANASTSNKPLKIERVEA